MPLRRRLLLVSLVCLILTLPVVSLVRTDAGRCGTVGECLGHTVALMGYTLILPLLGWSALRLLKVPAPFGHALLAWVIGLFLYAVGSALATAIDPPAPFGSRPLLPWPWLLLFSVVAGAIATPLTSPALRPDVRPDRRVALACAGLALVLFPVLVGSRVIATNALDRAHRDAIAHTRLTAYLPELPQAQPGRAIAAGDRIRIWYDSAEPSWRPTVVLLPTPPDLCSSLTISDTASRASCRVTGTPDGGRVMRAPFAEYEIVAVTRGATTLLVDSLDTRRLGGDRVITALTSAPQVSLDDLADRYHPQY